MDELESAGEATKIFTDTMNTGNTEEQSAPAAYSNSL